MEPLYQIESGGQIQESWPSVHRLMLFVRPASRSGLSGSSSPAGPSSLNINMKRAREEGGTSQTPPVSQQTTPSSQAELDALNRIDDAGYTPADACLGLDHRPSSARHWWCGARLGRTDSDVFAQRARMASPVVSLPETYLIGVTGYKIHQKSVSESSISARYGHGPPLQSYGAIRREHTSRAVTCLCALADAWLFTDDLIPS